VQGVRHRSKVKQVYEQLQSATRNQYVGSKWRGQRAIEEEGEEWRVMKAGDVSNE
jgi:hypothetical protein